MKKTVKYLLTVTAMITLAFAFVVSSFAATNEKTYTDESGNVFKYTVANSEVTITDCKSPNADVVIPDTFEGYPVTVIGSDAFSLWAEYQNEEQGINRTLKSVKIPDTVKEIKGYAFYCCEALENVNMPKALERIGMDAFSFTGIKSLHIPDGVKEIYSGAFSYTKNLKTLTFGNVNDCVLNQAFTASGLEEVYIPKGVLLFDGVFADCPNLTTAVIDGAPHFVVYDYGNKEEIYSCEALFSGCPKLREVTLSADFTKINTSMFKGCASLEKITAPAVTELEQHAFEGCASLTSFDLSNIKSEDVGDYAFKGCTSLKDLGNYRPAVVHKSTFQNCSSLEYVDMSRLAIIYDYAFSGCSSLKEIDLTTVKYIWYFAFEKCSSLKELYIPDTMEIRNGAFNGCTGLEKIVIGDNCKSIAGPMESGALFMGCKNVKTFYIGKNFDLTIRKTVTLNADYFHLKDLTGLEKIDVSPENPYYFSDDGVLYVHYAMHEELMTILVCYPASKPGDSYSTMNALKDNDEPLSIAYAAFWGTKNLKNLEITKSVKFSEWCPDTLYRSFYSSSVENITFLDGCCFEWIEEEMFCKSQIRHIDFGDTPNIEDRAFAECQNLTGELYIPNCKYIGYNAFENCRNLTSVNLPNCESIRDEAFVGCENLEKVCLPKCTHIGSKAFQGLKNLKEVECGNCEWIENHAFYECTGLTKITLENCVQISDNAFYGCTGLTKIDLNNCKYIDYNAFYGCTGLTRVNLITAEEIGSYAFKNCTELCLAEFGNKACEFGIGVFENDTKLEVSCEKDTDAYDYAVANNIPFCVVEVNISAGDLQYTGNEIRPGIIVRISGMTLVQNKDYILEFNNNTEIGMATVTVHFIGDFEGFADATRTFYIMGRDIANGVTIEYVEDQIYSGGELRPEVVVKHNGKTLVEGVDYRIEYKSGSDTGTMLFTVYGMGNYTGSVDCYYNIIRRDIAEATAGKIPDSTYTGSGICPEPTLTWNGFTLIKDVDYEVRYFENINTGFATMVIYGKGNFCGTLKLQYRIFGKNIETAVVSEISDKEYTGEAITPDITVTFDGKILTKDVDYTVEYKNNVESGTAEIVINGIGNYSGTKTVTFRIYKNSVYSFTVFSETQMTATYDGTPLKPLMEVYFGETLLTEGVDYTVKLENNINAGTATVTICGIGKFEGERSYGFTILPCIVSEKDIAVSGDTEYNGTAVEPNITITKNGRTLVNGIDYIVTYANNNAVGTAYMTVTGIGNYAGSVEIEYEIYAHNVADNTEETEIPEKPDETDKPEAPKAPDEDKAPTVPEKEPVKNDNIEIPNTDYERRYIYASLSALAPIGLIIYTLKEDRRKRNKTK